MGVLEERERTKEIKQEVNIYEREMLKNIKHIAFWVRLWGIFSVISIGLYLLMIFIKVVSKM